MRSIVTKLLNSFVRLVVEHFANRLVRAKRDNAERGRETYGHTTSLYFFTSLLLGAHLVILHVQVDRDVSAQYADFSIAYLQACAVDEHWILCDLLEDSEIPSTL